MPYCCLLVYWYSCSWLCCFSKIIAFCLLKATFAAELRCFWVLFPGKWRSDHCPWSSQLWRLPSLHCGLLSSYLLCLGGSMYLHRKWLSYCMSQMIADTQLWDFREHKFSQGASANATVEWGETIARCYWLHLCTNMMSYRFFFFGAPVSNFSQDVSRLHI